MEFWKNTHYLKWYKSHLNFSFMANLFIEEFEENNNIPHNNFITFIKLVYCHSKSEEKMFANIKKLTNIFQDHNLIDINKKYTNQEMFNFCKSLLVHMTEEEKIVKDYLLNL